MKSEGAQKDCVLQYSAAILIILHAYCYMVGRVQVDLDALKAWFGGVRLAGWLLLGTGPVPGDLGRVSCSRMKFGGNGARYENDLNRDMQRAVIG